MPLSQLPVHLAIFKPAPSAQLPTAFTNDIAVPIPVIPALTIPSIESGSVIPEPNTVIVGIWMPPVILSNKSNAL